MVHQGGKGLASVGRRHLGSLPFHVPTDQVVQRVAVASDLHEEARIAQAFELRAGPVDARAGHGRDLLPIDDPPGMHAEHQEDPLVLLLQVVERQVEGGPDGLLLDGDVQATLMGLLDQVAHGPSRVEAEQTRQCRDGQWQVTSHVQQAVQFLRSEVVPRTDQAEQPPGLHAVERSQRHGKCVEGTQPATTGDEHDAPGGGRDQRLNLPTARGVVQHEEQPPARCMFTGRMVTPPSDALLLRREILCRHVRRRQQLPHRVDDGERLPTVAVCLQIDVETPGEPIGYRVRGTERQCGLPHPWHAVDRHHPRSAECSIRGRAVASDLGQFGVAAGEPRRPRGQGVASLRGTGPTVHRTDSLLRRRQPRCPFGGEVRGSRPQVHLRARREVGLLARSIDDQRGERTQDPRVRDGRQAPAREQTFEVPLGVPRKQQAGVDDIFHICRNQFPRGRQPPDRHHATTPDTGLVETPQEGDVLRRQMSLLK